jgi:general secretion pathway protein M
MNPLILQLQSHWIAMAPRERRMATLALALVALALLWWIALGPALRTLAAAPAEHAQLDAQLQQMATLQQRAKALQSQPRLQRDDALEALESSLQQSMGDNARLLATGTGDSATVTLRAIPPVPLAQWLTQARDNAHAVPREAHLTRSSSSSSNGGNRNGNSPLTGTAPKTPAAGSAKDAPPTVQWEGTLIMTLPTAQ